MGVACLHPPDPNQAGPLPVREGHHGGKIHLLPVLPGNLPDRVEQFRGRGVVHIDEVVGPHQFFRLSGNGIFQGEAKILNSHQRPNPQDDCPHKKDESLQAGTTVAPGHPK